MADPNHLKILLKGVEPWNRWREENHDIIPDLNGVDLQEQAIAGHELAGGQKFTKRFEHGANLRCANLKRAKLVGAQLQRSTLIGALMEGPI